MTDEQIIDYLEMNDATEEGKRSLVATIRNGVDTRIGGILMEALTDEEYEHFGKLREAGDDQAIWNWLAQVMGKDMSEVYEASLKDYLDTLKADL